MSDRELAIKLAADASELNKATQQGAAGLAALGKAGEQAGKEAQAGAAAITSAAKVEAEAIQKAKQSSQDAYRAQQTAMREVRAEANLLKQANRQLAMQMTDVVTSVASGMPVWMVAIQQGGQIKDAYGGIVPAGRAVLGMLTPLTVALGGSALAAAAMVVAYNQGASESQAYTRAIVMSGNAAGTTTGQLNEMAKAVARSGGTQGLAAEALAGAAGSGRVASQNLEMVAATAVRMQRTLGIAVGDTVEQFAALGQAPLQASEKLNAQHRYLTATIYDQIRALEKQGRVAEAGAIAQTAWAESLRPKLSAVEDRLGYVESAWRKVGDGAKWAWDQMLNIGRKDTAEEELAKLVAKRGDRQLGTGYGQMNESIKAAKIQSDAREMILRTQLGMAAEEAAARQKSQEDADKYIREAAQREAESKARTSANLQSVKDGLQAQADAYSSAERLMELNRGAALVTEEQFYAAKRALIGLTAKAQADALAAENVVLGRQQLYGAEAIARDAAVAHNRREMARINAKASADTVLANAQETISLEALSRAQVEFGWALEQANATRNRANSRDLAGRRQGDGARDRSGREAAITDQYNSDVDRLKSDRFNGRVSQANYTERLAFLRTYYNQALDQEQQYQDARARIEADATVGFDRALANYGESSRNQAAQTERLWSNAFTGMEDALVRFTMTGKGSFTDMANSIVADLMRIYIRQQLVGMVGQAFGAGANAFGGANSAGFGSGAGFGNQDMGQFFHGGGVVGREAAAFSRTMPASTWANAPRLHTGRLASDEYAAILQKDESVLTPGQMRQLAPAGGGSGAQVNLDLQVINQTGTPVAATARRTTGGGIELLLTGAEEQMAGNVAAGQGPMYAAFKGRFGLRD